MRHDDVGVDASYLALARAAEVEIVGLSDDDEALAKRRGEELGCGWTTDVDDLVTRFAPDLVIALPRPDRAPEQVGRLLDRQDLWHVGHVCRRPVMRRRAVGVAAQGGRGSRLW